MKKYIFQYTNFDEFGHRRTKTVPVLVSNPESKNIKIKSFIEEMKNSKQVKFLKVFGKKLSYLELKNYKLIPLDEWFDKHKIEG